MPSRLTTNLVLPAIVLLMTLACTRSATPVSTPTQIGTGTPQPSTTPMPTSASPSKELNLVSPIAVPHWDVHLSPSPVLASWGPGIVYSRLLRFRSGPEVATPNAATECDLCESWQQVDSTTYLFHLKETVLWQDIPPVFGRELVAQDIVFSLQRQANPSYPNAPLLRSIQSVEAEGKYTLRITLKAPNADFLAGLASGFTKIVAPEAVSLNGDLRDGPVIGSGPWLWDGTRDGLGYFFKANPHYYESDLPQLDRLNILVLVDGPTGIAAFRTKKVDLIESPSEEFDIIREDHPDAHFLLYREAGTGLELALKSNSPPLDNLQVRKAVLSTLDPWEAIDTVWDGLGFVTQGMPVANPDWLLPEEELRTYLASTARARNLLAGASPSFTLTIADYGDTYLEYGRHLAEQLEVVGFQVILSIVNPTDYPQEVWYDGDYQAFIGPIAPITTPNMYLFSVLHGQGAWNTHAYSDLTLDSLIEEQAITLDPSDRQELALEIQRHVMDKAVRFMPVTRVSTWVWWPRVKDFYPNLTSSEYFHLARLRVEP
ncbi:MAG: ABC transporter substrate-binding protein [Dehalococcoidia bacterium]|nr:ABC transporter substrate-binding protein [Dehalococcoidia bacterium]